MARRNILTKEEPGLYKKCRPVTEFNARLHQLLDDMADTLEPENGVGLAAPQVGVLRRAAREELPLAASDFYFKRAGKVELERFARILDVDYGIVHLQTRNNT